MAPDSQPILITPVPHEELNNHHLNVFGGWLMSQMDIAGSILSISIAKGLTVTKAVNHLEFINQGLPHDLFYFYGEVKKIGNSSVTINVTTIAKRLTKDCGDCEEHKIAEGEFIFVAIDAKGVPRTIEQ